MRHAARFSAAPVFITRRLVQLLAFWGLQIINKDLVASEWCKLYNGPALTNLAANVAVVKHLDGPALSKLTANVAVTTLILIERWKPLKIHWVIRRRIH